MGFETHQALEYLYQEFIWTISLWDLKLFTPATPKVAIVSFELFPYGIWNLQSSWDKHNQNHLNYFPMGFETECSQMGGDWFPRIWTISLWDLKLSQSIEAFKKANNLNYFPMGFET